MNVQVISRDGQPEYAVVPWEQYQQLLKAAGRSAQTKPNKAQAALASLRELKAVREQAGLSVEEVARDVGISPHYLAMIESGEREVSEVLKRALARTLRVSGWQDE